MLNTLVIGHSLAGIAAALTFAKAGKPVVSLDVHRDADTLAERPREVRSLCTRRGVRKGATLQVFPGVVRLAAVALILSIAVPVAAMTLAVDAEGVTVSGLPSGARVILFGVGREPLRYQSAVHRWTEVLVDEDRNGVVRYAAAITYKSIWIGVDLDTGDTVTGTGPGYPRREVTHGFSVKRNNAGQLSKLENARGRAELLVVRPRTGAWRLSAAKKSAVDEARDNPSAMRLDASSFQPVRDVASEELKHLKRGDVVALIDPRRMEFSVLRVHED